MLTARKSVGGPSKHGRRSTKRPREEREEPTPEEVKAKKQSKILVVDRFIGADPTTYFNEDSPIWKDEEPKSKKPMLSLKPIPGSLSKSNVMNKAGDEIELLETLEEADKGFVLVLLPGGFNGANAENMQRKFDSIAHKLAEDHIKVIMVCQARFRPEDKTDEWRFRSYQDGFRIFKEAFDSQRYQVHIVAKDGGILGSEITSHGDCVKAAVKMLGKLSLITKLPPKPSTNGSEPATATSSGLTNEAKEQKCQDDSKRQVSEVDGSESIDGSKGEAKVQLGGEPNPLNGQNTLSQHKGDSVDVNTNAPAN